MVEAGKSAGRLGHKRDFSGVITVTMERNWWIKDIFIKKLNLPMGRMKKEENQILDFLGDKFQEEAMYA